MWKIYDSKVIGAAGISGSGKSTLLHLCAFGSIEFSTLSIDDIAILEIDHRYRSRNEVFDIQGIDQSKYNTILEALGIVNWDDPRLLAFLLIIKDIEGLLEHGEITMPIYDKLMGVHTDKNMEIKGNKLIFLENFLLFSAQYATEPIASGEKAGQMVMQNPSAVAERMRELIDVKLYVDCHPDVARTRRYTRDATFGRHPKDTRRMWNEDVMPAAERYIFPLCNPHRQLLSPGLNYGSNFDASPMGIFNRVIDNTFFRPDAIDSLIIGLVSDVKGADVNKQYQNPQARQAWINKWYDNHMLKQAQQIYDLHQQANHK